MTTISLFLLETGIQSADPAVQIFHSAVKEIHLFGTAGGKDSWKGIPGYFYTGDRGKALNKAVKKVKTDAVLFLQEGDRLNSKTAGSLLDLLKKYPVITADLAIKEQPLTKPLLVSRQELEKTGFPEESLLPFKEAVLQAWLNQAGLKYSTGSSILIHPNQEATANRRAKAATLQKYVEKPALKQTTRPELAIMISAYNMADYISCAVNSCLLQHELPEHIYIMDDGSTDKTSERLKRWAAHPQVSLFQKKNGGKARALNDLLAYIEEPFILELDADDWLDPDAVYQIKKQLPFLSKRTAALFGNLRIWKQNSELTFKSYQRGRKVRNASDLLHSPFPICPRIYKTSYLKEAGGFPILPYKDGRMFEDVSVLYRLAKKYVVEYGDFSIYNVREHPKSITKTTRTNWDDYLKVLQSFL